MFSSKKVLRTYFFLLAIFSPTFHSVKITTEITTTPKHFLFLEKINNTFYNCHLLIFCVVRTYDTNLFYKHQLLFSKNNFLKEDINDADFALTLPSVFAVATEKETEIFSSVTTSRKLQYSLNRRNFLLNTNIEQLSAEQRYNELDIFLYRLTINLQFPTPSGELRLLPSNEKINYFVVNKLLPLPVKFSKKMYASFFIFIDKDTFVTARIGVTLQSGSFINGKTFLTSFQIFKLIITENRVVKVIEQNIPFFGAFLNYTVSRKTKLVFYAEGFKIEVKFPLSLLISEADQVYISNSSEDVGFKLNEQTLVLKGQTFSFIEKLFHSINSFIVEFKTVEMIVSFPKIDKRGKLTLFFPVIEAVCATTVAEISFIFLQTFEPEGTDQEIFSANLISLFLDFSRKSSVEFLKCYVENREVEFFLPLLLTKDQLERGNYRLNMNYGFEELGLSPTKRKTSEIFLDFSQQTINDLTVGVVVQNFIKNPSSIDCKYLLSTRVISTMITSNSISFLKKKRFFMNLNWFINQLIELKNLFYSLNLLGFSGNTGERVTEVKCFLSTPVSDLHLLASDFYLHLDETEKIEKNELLNELLKEVRETMQSWKEIINFDIDIAFSELLGSDQENNGSFCSLVKLTYIKAINCLEFFERITKTDN